jgi:hypothetical protein
VLVDLDVAVRRVETRERTALVHGHGRVHALQERRFSAVCRPEDCQPDPYLFNGRHLRDDT